jgi:hypothetical protein
MTIREAILLAEEILPGVPAPEEAEDPRWRRIIEVGEYVRSEPEQVWAFVERWGSHDDADLRDAVATVLLEHLLEHHFGSVFPRVERQAAASQLFADTFGRCWKLGQALAPENAARFDALASRYASPLNISADG